MRVRLMPLPSRLDDALDVDIVGFPVERLESQSIVGDELGWVACASTGHDGGDRMASHSPAGFDDF